MWNKEKSTTLSLAVCYFFTALLITGLFLGPWAIRMWFQLYRGWEAGSDGLRQLVKIFNCCFYPSAPFGFVTLYSLIKLLLNIRKGEIFIVSNVRNLRRISWCCFIVAAITAVGGVFYLPFFFITIAAAFIGLLLRVVKNVMENAVEIKAENELTI